VTYSPLTTFVITVEAGTNSSNHAISCWSKLTQCWVISLLPLYPRVTIDLHVRIAIDLHQFSLTKKYYERLSFYHFTYLTHVTELMQISAESWWTADVEVDVFSRWIMTAQGWVRFFATVHTGSAAITFDSAWNWLAVEQLEFVEKPCPTHWESCGQHHGT